MALADLGNGFDQKFIGHVARGLHMTQEFGWGFTLIAMHASLVHAHHRDFHRPHAGGIAAGSKSSSKTAITGTSKLGASGCRPQQGAAFYIPEPLKRNEELRMLLNRLHVGEYVNSEEFPLFR